MNFKLLGSVLLIVGTSIGAGMLGLPIAAAQLGFAGAFILLLVCWFVMTVGAFLILEVNLWLPQNTNLITMAKVTMGPVGQLIAWITYLLLLYSLLCAYIVGGSDLLHHLLMTSGIYIPVWVSSILFTSLFGSVVYFGIRSVDYVNRGLMFFKLGAYFILVVLMISYISVDKLAAGDFHYMTSASAITVTATAFGFAIIIPSLRVYFANDIKKLKIAIMIGSIIPLVCYIAWDAVIMGIIPLHGEHSLISILHSPGSTGNLVATLDAAVEKSSVTFFVKIFTSICVLTSFLGVSLCLTDFLADGFQLEKVGMSNILIHALTFIPALIIALYFPNIFIQALSHAGIYATILLILLPACMAWNGRYRRAIATGFKVPGGKAVLLILIVFSFP